MESVKTPRRDSGIFPNAGEKPALPSMRDSLTNPVHVYEGDDALITCVVKDIGANTVMWKKEVRERHSTLVLTAGENRVTADKRFGVLHDSGKYRDENSRIP
ncbi:hypothetical protein NQ315_016023 [Exocentrus adspersus]|uniref:Ig-like domain-containing protein n=1 Tax=Exocentrus adspersus TaxID=1586481 RepID=A0AAV8VLA4_9CUCU|nr:hypothetical protein NQ315_016023 [Exocentrus adspersus]